MMLAVLWRKLMGCQVCCMLFEIWTDFPPLGSLVSEQSGISEVETIGQIPYIHTTSNL